MQTIKFYLKNITGSGVCIAILYFLILYQVYMSNHEVSIYPLQLLLTQGIQGDAAVDLQRIIFFTWFIAIFSICLKAYHLRTFALCLIVILTGFRLWIFANNFILFWQLEPLDILINLFMAILAISLLLRKLYQYKINKSI